MVHPSLTFGNPVQVISAFHKLENASWWWMASGAKTKRVTREFHREPTKWAVINAPLANANTLLFLT